MSKKVVRSRESYMKNWTAAITGSFVLVSAQAAQAEHQRGAFREFRAENPGLERRELRQAFREQFRGGSLVICPVENGSGTLNNSVPVINTENVSRHQQRIEAKLIRHDGAINQTFQATENGFNNIQRGVDLDLTSQVANITLGSKLFGNTSSVEISVGGVTKTVSAGSQVTAAEYVAAKQVLAGAGQRLTIGAGGAATGGDIDLSAITGQGDVLRASDLTVPVNVTTTGDFSKGSDFRLLGDLTNNGTVHALDGSGNGRGGTLRADSILNNSGALISSDVDLNLQGDKSITNYGTITSAGNLTLTSASITNRGSVSSAKDVNLNAAPGASLSVDNTGSTISAANNINVNAGDLDARLTGGNYHSQNLNLNAGAGTITATVGNVTGDVNSTGYAVHFSSASETLNIGATDLIDPTFYNLGNINFTGSVNVAADLTVIATGNITDSSVASINITTNNAGAASTGGNLTLIAGANITSASDPASPSLPGGTSSEVTFNQGSIGGGSITLSRVQLNTSGSAGGSGGNVLLAAFQGTTAGSGSVDLSTTFSSSITTGGNGAGTNGNVTVIAPNGINLSSTGGTVINTTGGTDRGNVEIVTAQPTSTGPVTYLANGSLFSGQIQSGLLWLFQDATITDATVNLNTVIANGTTTVVSGGSQTVGNVTSANDIALFAGVNLTNKVINPAATLTLNGDVTSTAGAILLETADNLAQGNNNDLTAKTSVLIEVGVGNGAAPGGADYNQLGSVTAQTGQVSITVGDAYTLGNGAGDAVTGAKNVSIQVGTQSGAGDMTQNAAITAGAGAGVDGNVDILVTGDYDANSGSADTTAGQGAGNVGTVTISAGNLQTVAGANILGNDVFLTASTDAGDFDLAGAVTANKAGDTKGILSLTLNGSGTADISDNDVTGGLFAQQINLTNNAVGGTISILNNSTPINFRDVTANATSDITLVEPLGGGRDGNINFTGTSSSGGTFTVITDLNLSNSALGKIGGVTGDLKSNNGDIGSSLNPINVSFSSGLRVQALGAPSPTVGNAYLAAGSIGINFTGANSQVTGVLEAKGVLGDITTSGSTTVFADRIVVSSLLGNVGTDELNPFRIDTGSTVGSGVIAASLIGDVFIFDPNSARVRGGSALGTFSIITGTGDLNVDNTAAPITADKIALSSGDNLNLDANTIVSGTTSVFLKAFADITSAALTSRVTGGDLTVDVGGTGTLNTAVDSLTTQNGLGSLTINEDTGIDLNGQAALASLTVNASQNGSGDVVTNNNFSVGTLSITNSGGDILINSEVTGTTSVSLDTSGGGGAIGDTGKVISPTISLLADTGEIDLEVDGISGGSTSVTAQSGGGGDVAIDYLGGGKLTLNASSGNDDYTVTTLQSTSTVEIAGDISGTGILDVTANRFNFTGAFTLDFDSASVQSQAGSGLRIDGGFGSGGLFKTTKGGAGVTLTATDGNFEANARTNFQGGDLFVTLANNNGVNAFDVSAPGAQLSGDTLNNITIRAALVTGDSLAPSHLNNWANITLLGTTIQNSNGDITLPSNLIFQGQSLAIIASGNVTATGAVLIDLSSAFIDGGTLTVLAGVDSTPATMGQVIQTNPVTITGLSATGGSIDLTGVTIDTRSKTGDGGNVRILASSPGGMAINAGTVVVGDIFTNGAFNGGTVQIGGYAGVTVGNISTTGSKGTSGNVALGVASTKIVGTPVITDGVSSGGGFQVTTLESGNIAYGNINAGTADVTLAGGFDTGNTIAGGTITANDLSVFIVDGKATLDGNVDTFAAKSIGTGGDVTLNEAGDVTLNDFSGSSLFLQVNAVGDITVAGDVNVGDGVVGLKAVNIFDSTSKITANSLNVDLSGTGTVATNVNSLTSSGATGSLTVNEDDGVTLGAQAALTSLTVNAGQSATGDIETNSTFSVGTLALNTANNGGVIISDSITGTTSISIDTSSGTGGVSGGGTLISPTIKLNAGSGGIVANVNGISNSSTTVTAQATAGDVDLSYIDGTGTLTLAASKGNSSFTASVDSILAIIDIAGNIGGTGALDITTNTLSFSGAFDLGFDSATVQSLDGNGLALTGANGSFTTAAVGSGVTLTATDGNFIETGTTNFYGGDLAVTLANNDGTNSVILTGILNGDTTNDVTVTAAVIVGDPNTQLTNWANVFIVQGNTIVNNAGDVTLGSNLTFQGQSLAIIASGNVTMTGSTIDLSSSIGDGGDLTVLAGYTSTGTAAGQVQTPNPVTITGTSAGGGNIVMTGVNITTSSTFAGGSAGDVLMIASGGTTNAGTVAVGNITATGDANGGLVAVGGSSDVTVGNINTVGTSGTDGQVLLAVGTASIVGTPVVTNGVLSGGSFVPTALTAGDLLYGTVNAGTGDVSLGGAFSASDSIGGGVITADTLSYTIGGGTAVSAVGSNSNRINVDATAAAGGSVTVNEADNVIIDNVAGTNLNLTVNANPASGDIDIAGTIAVGTGSVNLGGNDVTQSTGTLTATNLGLNLTGNATLTTTITNLLDSSFANMTLTNTGNLTVNDITSTGFVDIFNTGNLTVAVGSVINAVDRITLQTLGSTPGTINIGAGSTIATAGAVKSGPGVGDVSILQGLAPTRTKNLKGSNIEVNPLVGDGLVLTGKGKGTKKITALAPDNVLSGINATLLIKAQTKNGVTLGGGTTITADPPEAAVVALAEPRRVQDAPALSAGLSEALLNAPSALSPINTVSTLTSAPAINLNTMDNTISNLATVSTNLGALGQMEDDSYMVTYAPMGQIVDGHVCSDMDFGFVSGGNAGSGKAVATMEHSDCVTLNNGSALFVPSKAMTVVTPRGSVKLAANSVAYVNANSDQLSVYDISDNHKASVVVSTGGRELTLSPGRHLVVTHDRAKNFAEVNPIESIMHRSVRGHELGAGKRAFVSEFSIPSAVNVVKPLKAMLNSNDADAKKVAARIIKTSAVVMMVGGQQPFDFHTKPRTVALNWK